MSKQRKAGENVPATEDQLAKIRRLKDFDLVMFLSEVDEHGWEVAIETLTMIPEAS